MRRTRRPRAATTLLLALVASFVLSACTGDENGSSEDPDAPKPSPTFAGDFDELEKEHEARLGVYALDTGTEQVIEHRADERFAHASTIKALLVGALVQQQGVDALDVQEVAVGPEDVVPGSEKVVEALEEQAELEEDVAEPTVEVTFTLRELSDAAVRHSDNTAANLLLDTLGGPEVLEQTLRDLGDEVTDVESYEPELNNYDPTSESDTSTPRALATTLHDMTLGDALGGAERAFLTDLMVRSTTGDDLVRAGVPDEWEVASKSGTATYGTRNDIAVVRRPDGDPIVLVVMSRHDDPQAEASDDLVADAARIVVDNLQ